MYDHLGVPPKNRGEKRLLNSEEPTSDEVHKKPRAILGMIFSDEFKAEVIDYSYDHTVRQASQKYSVGQHRIFHWRKDDKMKNSTERAGRPLFRKELEKQLLEGIMKARLLDLKITIENVQECAIKLAEDAGIVGFRASQKWFDEFAERHAIRLKVKCLCV